MYFYIFQFICNHNFLFFKFIYLFIFIIGQFFIVINLTFITYALIIS